MADKTPLISVIVPHLNQTEELKACLDSLSKQEMARARFEIIVVDNGSSSSLETTIREHPGTVLLNELTRGPGAARNRGAQAAKGCLLAFIDADCRAHPNWLRVAVDEMKASLPGTVIGGDVRVFPRDPLCLSAAEAYDCVFGFRFKLYIEKHGYSGTGNLIVRRLDFEKVGPFAGVDIAEDLDWGIRARAMGFAFHYVPELIVFHRARGTLREILVKWDRHIKHELNRARANPQWRFFWGARAILVLFSPFVDCIQILLSDRIEGAGTRVKAACALFLVRFYRAGIMLASFTGSDEKITWNSSAHDSGGGGND